MQITDITKLSLTLTEKQFIHLNKNLIRYKDEVVTIKTYLEGIIAEGYKLYKGDKNSYRVINSEGRIQILNAAEAKLFSALSSGLKGDIRANGYSTYIIT